MEINKSLQELGLTQNEITVFLYLLSHGESLGSQIPSETQVEKYFPLKIVFFYRKYDSLISYFLQILPFLLIKSKYKHAET